VAGYSGTPLARKLGLKPGGRLAVLGAADGFESLLAPLPEGTRVERLPAAPGAGAPPLALVLLFAPDQAALDRHLAPLARALDRRGALWIAWPKKSSGLPTDLAFAPVQRAGLDLGLVDNKVCAVDEVWSGLRFVYRLQDR
jgi:hypothetical protein